MNIEELRSEFENIPNVNKKLRWHIWFDGTNNRYDSYRDQEEEDRNWLNGAWFMFRELRSKPLSVRDDVFQKKGEPCNHYSTTMFNKGVAKCFNCGSMVNENREVLELRNEQI